MVNQVANHTKMSNMNQIGKNTKINLFILKKESIKMTILRNCGHP